MILTMELNCTSEKVKTNLKDSSRVIRYQQIATTRNRMGQKVVILVDSRAVNLGFTNANFG